MCVPGLDRQFADRVALVNSDGGWRTTRFPEGRIDSDGLLKTKAR
jgi:hypothetical protein